MSRSYDDLVARGRVQASRLLERAHEEAALAAAVDRVRDGRGGVVLVSGEAGLGKSTLVATLDERVREPVRLLLTGCDDLTTRRTYGPLRDLAGAVGVDLADALRDGTDREHVLAALRAELSWHQRPTVLVVEDLHWADDATVDALTHLARRADRLPALLVLTYREEEVGADHAVTALLGQLATGGSVVRLRLRPLSREAVAALAAGTAVDPDRLFDATGGNPFFVTEVLRRGAEVVPSTVVDLVRGRLHRLDAAGQDAVERLSVVPARAEPWLVDAVVPGGAAALRDAEDLRLVVVAPSGVAFAHELTRRAVVDALPVARTLELHRRVLAALLARGAVDLSRLVHHAARAGDVETLLRVGPDAAREAAAAGAHREAAGHLRLVLEHADRFASGRRAALLEALAVECYTLGAAAEAVAAQERAVALRRTLGDDGALAAALRWLSRMHWWNGDAAAAEEASLVAVEVAGRQGDDRARAMALSNRAQLLSLADRTAESIPVGERAVALARAADDRATLSHALTNVGMSRWLRGEPAGPAVLEEALRVALAAGETEHALRAYVAVCSLLLDDGRLHEAAERLDAAVALADTAEQLGYLEFLVLERARLHLHRGAWEALERDTARGLAGSPPLRWGALLARGRMGVRRGLPGARALLREAWELSAGMAELQRAAPVAAGLAEAAWLTGDLVAVRRIAGPVHVEARRLHSVAAEAEMASWLVRAGVDVQPLDPDRPTGLQATGRWSEAAAAWRGAGAPFEEAAALAGTGDPRDLSEALALAEGIGAEPLARLVRRCLRTQGLPAYRGRARSARDHPLGLTARQADVLTLVAEGRTNAEIADTLVLSERTVESHVAAVLARLGAVDRRDAVRRATALAQERGSEAAGGADLRTGHGGPADGHA